jgi:very-short-patch-repair endonuclease
MIRGLKIDHGTLLILQLRENKIPDPVREYRFHPSRRWRFDYAWPNTKIAVEIDGGGFKFGGGKHMQPRDLEKLNTAASMGWKVYRFTPTMIKKGQAIKFLLKCS